MLLIISISVPMIIRSQSLMTLKVTRNTLKIY